MLGLWKTANVVPRAFLLFYVPLEEPPHEPNPAIW